MFHFSTKIYINSIMASCLTCDFYLDSEFSKVWLLFLLVRPKVASAVNTSRGVVSHKPTCKNCVLGCILQTKGSKLQSFIF